MGARGGAGGRFGAFLTTIGLAVACLALVWFSTCFFCVCVVRGVLAWWLGSFDGCLDGCDEGIAAAVGRRELGNHGGAGVGAARVVLYAGPYDLSRLNRRRAVAG